MNVASALPTAKFTALLIEEKPAGIENTLREEGCSVRRATSRAAAIEALAGVELVVVASGLSDDDVLEVVTKANTSNIAVLVMANTTDLAVRAGKLGAAVIVGGSVDLAGVQIKQLLGVVDLKRKIARQSASVTLSGSPTSGVVQRRSAPLPKEATPDALDALIEAAESLVPMHKFQRVYVDYALRRFGGNKVHTAAALGIDRRTIQRWARARAEQRPAGTTTTTTNSNTTS